jgi:hypothetical protein
MEYKSSFIYPRLARFNEEQQYLAEMLILQGGNLKEMAQELNISYPTLKKRLMELSEVLKKLRAEDEKKIENILNDIEQGKIDAKEGMRLIKEYSCGL